MRSVCNLDFASDRRASFKANRVKIEKQTKTILLMELNWIVQGLPPGEANASSSTQPEHQRLFGSLAGSLHGKRPEIKSFLWNISWKIRKVLKRFEMLVEWKFELSYKRYVCMKWSQKSVSQFNWRAFRVHVCSLDEIRMLYHGSVLLLLLLNLLRIHNKQWNKNSEIPRRFTFPWFKLFLVTKKSKLGWTTKSCRWDRLKLIATSR